MLLRLTEWLTSPIAALFKWLAEYVIWFYRFMSDLPANVFSWFGDGIVSFFDSMPVPSFFNQASSAFGSIPSEVGFFMGLCQFNYGIALILSAYLLRFILRRIPLIG